MPTIFTLKHFLLNHNTQRVSNKIHLTKKITKSIRLLFVIEEASKTKKCIAIDWKIYIYLLKDIYLKLKRWALIKVKMYIFSAKDGYKPYKTSSLFNL